MAKLLVTRRRRTWGAVQFDGSNAGEVADFAAPSKVVQMGNKLHITQRWGDNVWCAPGQYVVKLNTAVPNDDDDTGVQVMHEEEFVEKYEQLPDRSV